MGHGDIGRNGHAKGAAAAGLPKPHQILCAGGSAGVPRPQASVQRFADAAMLIGINRQPMAAGEALCRGIKPAGVVFGK